MSRRRENGKTRLLIVGPLHEIPWNRAQDVAAAFRRHGYEVDLHNPLTGENVFPYPEPFRGDARWRHTFLPFFLAGRIRAYWKWARSVRRDLRRSGVDHIFVWDTLIAVLMRLARPRTARVHWIAPAAPDEGLWDRLLRRAALTWCAHSVLPTELDRPKQQRRSRISVVSYGGRVIEMARHRPAAGAWAFLMNGPLGAAQLHSLSSLAKTGPASAIVFDGRRRDNLPPHTVEAALDACCATKVVHATGPDWVGELELAFVVDFEPLGDHRHWAALDAGVRVLVPVELATKVPLGSVRREESHGSWAAFSRDGEPPPADTLDAWTASVLRACGVTA